MGVIIPAIISFALSYTFPELMGLFGISVANEGAWINLVHIPYITVVPMIIYFFNRKLNRPLLVRVFSLKYLNKGQALFLIIGSVGVWGISQAVNSFVNMYLFHFMKQQPVQLMPPQSMLDAVIGFIAVCLVTPFFEELFYRGVVLSSIARKNVHMAIFLSSILFALAHKHPGLYALGLIYGLFSGYAVKYTKSIYAGILIHMTCNFITLVLKTFDASDGATIAIIIAGIVLLPLCVLGLIKNTYTNGLGGNRENEG